MITTTYDVLRATARALRVPEATILGRKRTANVAHARHVAMWLARRDTRASYPDLAIAFSRDHTTVIAAVQKMDRLIAQQDKDALADIEAVRKELQS